MRDTEQGQARLLGGEHNEGEEEMQMRYLTACFFVMLCVCGCSSYRFVAIGEKTDYIPKKKYRIASLTIHVPLGYSKPERDYNNESRFVRPDWWSIPQAASLYNIAKLQSMIIQEIPNMVADDPSAVPIDINIRCVAEDNYLDWTGLFSTASLSILPFYRRITSTCEVGVTCSSVNKQTKTKVHFQTDCMHTGISPIGLIPFSRLPDTVSQVIKTRVDGAGPVDQQDALKRNDAKEVVSVFSEAISYAIITQLKSLEDKNLQ